ncbi:hypothetical protein HU200_036939 [Digitaria exilis]|uniref:FAS1 domain-containing protein n=1 Tax=Digitaria exilis TaxID=1010633 RepID=A0A835EJM1_9POAL|nr:hypothetical protein HU200_036939 [Digitaria exilis]
MAALAFPLPLSLLLASLLLSAAAAASPAHHGAPTTHAHLPHHGHGHGHHHRSPSMMATTARFDTAPSMHQNLVDPEESRQSLRVLDPFFTPVATQASSGEEAVAAMGAASADTVDPTPLDVPRSPSPPPSSVPAADQPSASLASQAEDTMWSAPEAAVAPPPVDEATATTTTTPYRAAASPPPPVNAAAAGTLATSGDDLGLQQLAKVLASLGYNEMASAATLLANTASVATWPRAITVFAAPDIFFQAACPGCSRRRLLLDHMALGYFPYAELAAAPTMKLPSASVGFCLDIAAVDRGPFSVHRASLYVHGVKVSHPELYNDGRYVVHGLRSFIPPLSHASCVEGTHRHHHQVQVQFHHHSRHHLSARSAAASVVRVMIRDAISRLRDGGFGFVALAMRVKFAELEKLANLTVFALDDQAIFFGGGHDYVSAVRFHIVPGHRLTHADLLQLQPGAILPTLAGVDQKLVITRSATDEVWINYIPMKKPDAVINSRVVVHGIYGAFPHLHLANLAASVAVAYAIQTNSSCDVGGPFGDCAPTEMTSATIPAAQGYGDGQ